MLLEIRTGKFLSLFLLPQRLHLTLFIHPHPIQHKLKILNLYYIWTNCYCCCSSVAQSCPTLPPHGPQHARLPCLSQPPGVCSNLCPFSQCCHPTILSFIIPFSSCLQYFTASGALLMSQLFLSGGQSIWASALAWTNWISAIQSALSSSNLITCTSHRVRFYFVAYKCRRETYMHDGFKKNLHLIVSKLSQIKITKFMYHKMHSINIHDFHKKWYLVSTYYFIIQ